MPVDVQKLAKAEAPRVARQLDEAAQESLNEAEFRGKAADIFQKFADSAGVTLRRHDEYAVASGRADTVYNRLVIEYKAPGKLTAVQSTINDRAIQQIVGYINDIAAKEHHQVSRMAGIILDGKHAIFLRFFEKSHVVDPPVELTPDVVERLLKYLASLAAGVALVPENLLRDFATDSRATQRAVKALYEAIQQAPRDSLSDQLLFQWQIFFQEVSGYQSGSSQFASKPELHRFVSRLGLHPAKIDPPRLLFAVHTYFALIIKMIAWLALSKYLTRVGTSFSHLATLSGEHLKAELAKLERGGLFRELGIRNLLEGDFFGWYLDSWNDDLRDAIKMVLERLGDYDPGTLELNPEATRDLLKKLYHYLLPRELRHDLGEYYTPDWLAELTLDRLEGPEGFSGNPNLRILDPACGSGTFLILAIRAIREAGRREMVSERDVLHRILENVVGIDLNPLAVIASRTNYILAILELLEYRTSEIDIPVYLADSVLIPARTSEVASFGNYRIKTAVGVFELSPHLATRERVDALANSLDDSVASGVRTAAFLERVRVELKLRPEEFEASSQSLMDTYERILQLHQSGLDGIWARIIKNAFAPLFIGKFDYIAGNPPWINWESLPPDFRKESESLWKQYGLESRKEEDDALFVLGSKKRDLSMLFMYRVLDKFLSASGKLSFVMTQTVFKSVGSGRGFRRFVLPDGSPLKCLHVDDLVQLNPFESATNRTSVLLIERGQLTRYPVRYQVWRVRGRRAITYDTSLTDVIEATERAVYSAEPVIENDLSSPWITAPAEVVNDLRKLVGISEYRAFEGINTGGANGVFWVSPIEERPDGFSVVKNMPNIGRKKVDLHEAAVERDLIFPLARGRDVRKWRSQSQLRIILPHTPQTGWKAIGIDVMESRFPKALAYLRHFEKVLRSRSVFAQLRRNHPFYIMVDVNEPIFARYKVLIREISTGVQCAASVTERGKPPIPDHKLLFVPCRSADEAFYLAGVLNSTVVSAYAKALMISTHYSTKMLGTIRIPAYDSEKKLHREIVSLSKKAHEIAEMLHNNRNHEQLGATEVEIDERAARLLGVSYPDLQSIRRWVHHG